MEKKNVAGHDSNPRPSDFEFEFEENLLCEIEVEGKKKVLIGSLYRSPTSSDNNFKLLCKLMG